MKTPVLIKVHEQLGGKIGEFAGWMLPFDYGSAIKEVNAVRNAAGMFDVSHMGRLEVTGEGALDAMQKLFTNDVTKLEDNGGQYTLMCNPKGGVIDDLIIFKKSATHFYIVVNASNLEKDKDWILKHLPNGVALVDNSPKTALIAIQGPVATDVVVKAGLSAAADTKRFHLVHGQIAGRDVLATRTGYTGEDGFEVACANEDAETVWNTLLEKGKDQGVMPCGLAARDVLRTEACLPLYGHEMDEETTPVEAGLMRWVKLDAGDFIGRDAIASIVEKGPAKKLMGIEMEGRMVPRAEDVVETSAGKGNVTSGTFSPTLGYGIAMAYVPPATTDGDQIQVLIHGKPKPGLLKKVPLYSRKKK
jgi:aminomethyltransferase